MSVVHIQCVSTCIYAQHYTFLYHQMETQVVYKPLVLQVVPMNHHICYPTLHLSTPRPFPRYCWILQPALTVLQYSLLNYLCNMLLRDLVMLTMWGGYT